MSLEVIGKLHHIYETQQIKENFSKREFVLELTDESPSGMVYTNYASFQLVNNSCDTIDQFQPGESIKVNFNIRGNRWEKPDGTVKYISNLNAWRIEKAGETQINPSPGGFAQQQANPIAQQPTNPKPQDTNNTQAGSTESGDDLPF